MPYQLTITDDVASILLEISNQLHMADDIIQGMSDQEKVELGLQALVNSYESAQDIVNDAQDEGTPIDAAALKRALQQAINPDISTMFKQPEGEPQQEVMPALSWLSVIAKVPDNRYVIQAERSKDKMMADATCFVFAQLPENQWDLESTGPLISTAYDILKQRAG